ncbi:Sir2 family NAD-dependent protein deacetylase [Crassaminicella profunda]|uniref:Sir2 family NAD-dependent protein deacetylase n=1 Tax=Crassaminicella profunda TaxID=1286698 RepID=UPI001CA6A06C|nr:Sir2 family NAD-dependent protein deacetylase [Crassaminicella profunda]QZY56488.1 hypothetical protein K7H06_06060 [Crassaminicella profunda]
MLTKKILLEKIKNSRYPVAFTGAGISIPSGVPSFDIKYFNYSLTEILNKNFLEHNPLIFFKVYSKLVEWTNLKPNIVHYTLANLEIPIITQNIDGLHKKAGSKTILELHGNLEYLICSDCNYIIESKKVFYEYIDNFKLKNKIFCPYCHKILKPSLVLFGDNVQNFEKCSNEIYKADLLLIIGNSLKVWPANTLINKAIKNNCEIITINSSCEILFNFSS